MKKFSFLSITMIVAIAAVMTSCRSTRDYPPPPPPYRSGFSLIITPTPGFVMQRYRDGRYYHRTPDGYLYWRGYDNRFYLDRSYINRVRYNQWEYSQWRRHYRRR